MVIVDEGLPDILPDIVRVNRWRLRNIKEGRKNKKIDVDRVVD